MLARSCAKAFLILLTTFALVGCKSDAERADDFYRSGVELLEQGDVDRALVQFRNVFEFDQNHLEARSAMGKLFLEQNRPVAAYGQFLRIAEQYPEEFEPRLILSELAFAVGNWDEFERHGGVAVSMQPDNPRVQAVDIGLKYREAVLAEDDPAREALMARSETLLESLPANVILNNVLIDGYSRDGRLSGAIERIDALLANAQDDRQLHIRRLAVLEQLQDAEGMEAQLREMIQRFPGDQDIQGMLFRFYVARGELDEAETFLRSLADPTDTDPAMLISLVNFVNEVHGSEAARAEIERIIEVNPNPTSFRGMLATLDFQAGERNAAIAAMEEILNGSDVADPDIQAIKTSLAKMLIQVGNQVGARRHVEDVLAANPSNVDALKMQAGWQLQADEVDVAISNLRLVLDTAPADVQAMQLMAEAYSRLGDANLARDFLAQAVEASGNAPEPSLRYARLLMGEQRYLPAEDVLLPALQRSPGDVNLLVALGQLYLAMEDIPRTQQVIDTLNRIDTEDTRSLANALQADVLQRESGGQEAIAFLEGLASGEEADLRNQILLMRARLQTGEVNEALALAQKLHAENPDNLTIKQALAGAQAANGDLEAAAATFREVTEAAPEAAQIWLQRVRIARLMGDESGMETIVDEALEATNRAPDILWAKASMLEREGDIDGAIAIYEDLYEQNSSSVIVANNLASLLSTYKEDTESLDRAWVVGRRLKNSDNPALQDTYGWLLYRRGEFEEALPYLEGAAAGLDDPIVEAHLGFAYSSLGRTEEAITQLQRAVELAGPGDTRDRIEKARQEIIRLRDSLPEN